jgi:hypothetical protein
MAKQLIPEELDQLIQEYLTDGVLTDKERQVILRKAEGMGLDRDEIDLYLDAQVQKIDQQTDAAVRRQKSKACPYCGAPIPQLADKCPECGQYINPQASEELQEILENLEEALIDFKAGKDVAESKATVERYVRKAKLYFSNNPKIKNLLAEVEGETAIAEKKAISSSRKRVAIKVLTSKWLLYLLFVLLVPVFSFFKMNQNGDKSQAINEQINALRTEINAKYSNDETVETNWDGDVVINSLQKSHPEDYQIYSNKLDSLETKRSSYDHSMNRWIFLFLVGAFIALILCFILIKIQFFNNKK